MSNLYTLEDTLFGADGEKASMARYEGQVLLVLSAMKMEHKLIAGRSGVLIALQARAGETVPQGAQLARIEADS